MLIHSATVHLMASWCIIAPKNFCLQSRFKFHGNGGQANVTAHTDSQSEMAKVAAVNKASTNHPFTNWRSEMYGKLNLVNGWLS